MTFLRCQIYSFAVRVTVSVQKSQFYCTGLFCCCTLQCRFYLANLKHFECFGRSSIGQIWHFWLKKRELFFWVWNENQKQNPWYIQIRKRQTLHMQFIATIFAKIQLDSNIRIFRIQRSVQLAFANEEQSQIVKWKRHKLKISRT